MEDFAELYCQIHACHQCPDMDRVKARRSTQLIDPESDVMLIAQSQPKLGGRTSGAHYYDGEGNLTRTGEYFEKFFSQIRKTLAPPAEVKLAHGVISPRNTSFQTVYCTEMCQCHSGEKYAGFIRRNITRAPTMTEVKKCLQSGILIREIKLIRPRIIFLAGNSARLGFYRHILKTPLARAHAKMNITKEIEEIVAFREFPIINKEMDAIIIPIFYPEYRYFNRATYTEKMENAEFIQTINNALKPGEIQWRPPTLFPEDYMAY